MAEMANQFWSSRHPMMPSVQSLVTPVNSWTVLDETSTRHFHCIYYFKQLTRKMENIVRFRTLPCS